MKETSINTASISPSLMSDLSAFAGFEGSDAVISTNGTGEGARKDCHDQEPAIPPACGGMKRVIIESPYAGFVGPNLAYAREAMRDSLFRGEAPLASHLLYPQLGILFDELPDERLMGIDAGLAWGAVSELTAVYTDIGVSVGMAYGIVIAERAGRRIEYRSVPAWVRRCEGIDLDQARDHGDRILAAFRALSPDEQRARLHPTAWRDLPPLISPLSWRQ